MRKEMLMFTRIVECQVIPDKRDELRDRLRSEVLPVLQKQPGFVDLIGLVSENDPDKIVLDQPLEQQAGRGATSSRELQPNRGPPEAIFGEPTPNRKF